MRGRAATVIGKTPFFIVLSVLVVFAILATLSYFVYGPRWVAARIARKLKGSNYERKMPGL
jgi:hypothetical protein